MQVELTIKNVDDKIVRKLKAEADSMGMDLDSFILSIFKKELGFETQTNKDNVYNDLDYLGGTWSKEETEEFLKSIEHFSKIDEELWK